MIKNNNDEPIKEISENKPAINSDTSKKNKQKQVAVSGKIKVISPVNTNISDTTFIYSLEQDTGKKCI